ncbi:MAG TPA: hypothetical protein PLL20_13020 [Phycisphaerae bacterium]|nr:hypothetical protein [Phycisphaerae bacterium]HRR85852.1 hypothetical protein [Phycisphaerae bacterium]
MRNMTILTVFIGIAPLAFPAPAADTASAPTGDANLARCMADPPGWVARLDSELAAINKLIESAVEPVDQAAAHLAAANWLVGVANSRAAVRWLTGMQRPEDLGVLASRADQARKHLDKARDALKSVTQARPLEATRISELKLAAESLEPFIKLFAAAGGDETEAKRKSAFSEAALGLAMARESENPDLSACALLWQSFAWECAGRRDRAMLSLPSALAAPEQPAFDFLSRLLRCRLVAEDERHAAAFALALRVRASCNQWFPKEPPDQLAARARLAALVQYQIGRSWLNQLANPDTKTAADDVKEMLAALRDVLYDRDAPGPIFVPESIIPILVELPNPPVSQPASYPAGFSTIQDTTMPETTPAPTTAPPAGE